MYKLDKVNIQFYIDSPSFKKYDELNLRKCHIYSLQYNIIYIYIEVDQWFPTYS